MLCILFQQHILHNSPECVPSWAALHTSSITEQHCHYTSQHNMWNCGYNQTECFDCKWKWFFQCWWEFIEASATFSAVAQHQISWSKYQHTSIEHFIQLMTKMCLETWWWRIARIACMAGVNRGRGRGNLGTLSYSYFLGELTLHVLFIIFIILYYIVWHSRIKSHVLLGLQLLLTNFW